MTTCKQGYIFAYSPENETALKRIPDKTVKN
jgi:hypothetical protein